MDPKELDVLPDFFRWVWPYMAFVNASLLLIIVVIAIHLDYRIGKMRKACGTMLPKDGENECKEFPNISQP